MAFTRPKEELEGKFPEKECCRRAELSSLLRGHSRLKIGTDACELQVFSCRAFLSRRIYKMLKEYPFLGAKVLFKRNPHSYQKKVYLLEFKGSSEKQLAILDELGLAPAKDRKIVDEYLAKNKCCRGSYLRGAFLRGGSISITQNRGYHLEIGALTQKEANYMGKIAAKESLEMKVYKRSKGWVLYSRRGDTISGFLNSIGAIASLLDFEDMRAFRETKNNLNRSVNFETANLGRVAWANQAHKEAIEALKNQGLLDELPVNLQEVARLRLSFPYDDLKALGQKMKPPLSKSGIRHRLNRIMAIKANYFDEME